jgi:hypothetical protein
MWNVVIGFADNQADLSLEQMWRRGPKVLVQAVLCDHTDVATTFFIFSISFLVITYTC